MLNYRQKIAGILAVSRFTETDRNGPKRTFVDTETDFRGYRNGLFEYRNGLSGYRNGPERTETDFLATETDFLSTETDSLGTETDWNGPKRTFVNTETDSVGTESQFGGVKVDRNTKTNRYKLQCQAVQIGYVDQFLLNVFGVGVSCQIFYSIVSYLYVRCSGLITLVGEKRASLSRVVNFVHVSYKKTPMFYHDNTLLKIKL